MKRKNFGTKPTQWLSGCMLLGVSLTTLPAQAVTFSKTESNFTFGQFSDNALSSQAFTNTDTFTVSDGGTALADAETEALFIDDPAEAGNFVRTEAFVDAPSAFGFASGDASILGNFSVGAGDSFAFDFFGTLDLVATVDNPTQEIAAASSSVIFSVFNTTNATPVLLDIFELAAGISTADNTDFLSLNLNDQQSFSINGSQTFATLDFDGDTRGIQAQVAGRYSRFFADETFVSLVEVKQSSSTGSSTPENSQAIPEPTTSMLIGGLLSSGLWFKKRKKSVQRAR